MPSPTPNANTTSTRSTSYVPKSTSAKHPPSKPPETTRPPSPNFAKNRPLCAERNHPARNEPHIGTQSRRRHRPNNHSTRRRSHPTKNDPPSSHLDGPMEHHPVKETMMSTTDPTQPRHHNRRPAAISAECGPRHPSLADQTFGDGSRVTHRDAECIARAFGFLSAATLERVLAASFCRGCGKPVNSRIPNPTASPSTLRGV